jgi:hypothetical protein
MARSDGVAAPTVAAVRAELDRLDRRLRSLSVSAWRSRRAAVNHLLEQLAVLGAELESHSVPPMPQLPDYALADAVSVLAEDVLSADPSPSALGRLRREIHAALDATR